MRTKQICSVLRLQDTLLGPCRVNSRRRHKRRDNGHIPTQSRPQASGSAGTQYALKHSGTSHNGLFFFQGFDEFFRVALQPRHPPHEPEEKVSRPCRCWKANKLVELDPDADDLTKRFTERAVDFINRNKDEPFFLYVPHPIPAPALPHVGCFYAGYSGGHQNRPSRKRSRGREQDYSTRDELYFHSIREIDWSVGQILDR